MNDRTQDVERMIQAGPVVCHHQMLIARGVRRQAELSGAPLEILEALRSIERDTTEALVASRPTGVFTRGQIASAVREVMATYGMEVLTAEILEHARDHAAVFRHLSAIRGYHMPVDDWALFELVASIRGEDPACTE